MLKDSQELLVTTDSPDAIAAINRFIDQALFYGKDAEIAILQAITADPTCALAHAYAAAYYLSQENKIAWQQAQPHLQTAQKNSAKITNREQLYVQAILAWANKEIDVAIALHEEITNKFPQDLISVQQGQYHYFYLGDKERLLQIAQKVLPANPEHHYLYGMVAFGLEQCHQLAAAEAMARKATAMNRYNPWAHHAVAHVLETQGRVEEGIAWMESFADTWDNCNSMLYTHNWWHVALYYLERGDIEKVLSLYDIHIWGCANKRSPKDQVGAISLLLRLELRGVNVGSRWQEISAYLYPRIHEHALPFQDLHYVYAIAKAGFTNWVNQMLHSIEQHALSVNPFLRQGWIEVAIPAARGMVAHAKGDFNTAITQLKPVLPRLHEIGGSHAQRVLFKQVYQDALLLAEKQNWIYGITA
ncbi:MULTISPECIES: tetratricopeptide repeat protein [Fischerella]|uniref:Tetratricopeptide repeat protein 38 n=1 Tax=Fischerella muscicola CCMEE 5323 TaxID=2019572 RepID=A0A2N6K3L4_FISMU|nr:MULTISPECIES: tetratricopeptide repeat protein [Fischerella]MBD2433477.1 tetratricopeptide repeat protein [Fischerella sp. FACHB-380]PLZ90196.1 tetratricopeptide repeat-containing protein [Fischerella muscicola CCMEE 5323]